jgi:hypothetical protein
MKKNRDNDGTSFSPLRCINELPVFSRALDQPFHRSGTGSDNSNHTRSYHRIPETDVEQF